MNQFNLENQYKMYLQRVGLDENRMPRKQRVETKRAFFAACGQMLILLRDEMPDDEKQAVDTMQDMFNQVANFFIAESNKQN